MVDLDRVTGAAKDIGGRVQGAAGDLLGSNHDAIEGRLREAQGSAENLYGHAKDAVRGAAERAYGVAEDAYARGRHDLAEAHEQSTEWPHASLLVAGLVGFGLGLLVAKR